MLKYILCIFILIFFGCKDNAIIPSEIETHPDPSLCEQIQIVYKEINHLPYVWGGSTIDDNGLDCSGMVYYISKRIGKPLPRTTSQKYYLTIENNDNH